MNVKRNVGLAALAALTMVMLGGQMASANGSGKVRAFHNSPDTPPVDIYVGGEKVLANVAYGALSGYLSVPQGQHKVEVKVAPSTDDSPAALSSEVRVGGSPLTVAALGSLGGDGGALRLKVIKDASGMGSWSLLRVAHTSPDAPAVDVQVRIGNWWLPVIRNLSFGNLAGYLPLPASWGGAPIRYDFRVVAAGTNQAVLDLPGTELPGGRAVTVWAVGFLSPSGNANGFKAFVSTDGR
ncbi:MAG: DUF4397 domain-containing protein [Chloroflexi bacterium CFX6]|nr:DUF4397 domain-containing protein [Chloroflexi bacterium CFX6]